MTAVPIQCLGIAVLTISDTRTLATDKSGGLAVEMLEASGHQIRGRAIIADDVEKVRGQVKAWLATPEIEVVVTTGGTGITYRDVTPEALFPLITKPIEGFGELFRSLSYADIGPATIQSRAFGGLCGGTLLFALPGSPGAVRLALEKILLPQLDSRSKPCNFAELLPKIRGEAVAQKD